MNAFRMSGTVAADRTITVKMPPEASVGAEAEIIVLFSQEEPRAGRVEGDPLTPYLEGLNRRADRPSTWREEQEEIRRGRAEWD